MCGAAKNDGVIGTSQSSQECCGGMNVGHASACHAVHPLQGGHGTAGAALRVSQWRSDGSQRQAGGSGCQMGAKQLLRSVVLANVGQHKSETLYATHTAGQGTSQRQSGRLKTGVRCSGWQAGCKRLALAGLPVGQQQMWGDVAGLQGCTLAPCQGIRSVSCEQSCGHVLASRRWTNGARRTSWGRRRWGRSNAACLLGWLADWLRQGIRRSQAEQ